MSQLTGYGSAFPSSGTTDVFTQVNASFPMKVGTRARDTAGNEFVFVDFTAQVYAGVLVQLTDTWLASPLLGTANVPAPIGVVCASAATSDQGGWVQIYGLCTFVQTSAASDTSTSGVAGTQGLTAQTSVTTPSGQLAFVSDSSTGGVHIYNMWISNTTLPDRVSDSSGPATNTSVGGDAANQTSATSWFVGTSVACWLNYPYVTGQTMEIVT